MAPLNRLVELLPLLFRGLYRGQLISGEPFEFDPADAAAVAEALARFNQLSDAGFTAAVRTGQGSSQLVRHFDPDADETVFFPRLRGG